MTGHNQVLLTGHTGFLGKALQKALAEQYEVVPLLDINKSRINITLPFKLDSNPDIIVHAAGKAHFIPKTTEEENQFFDINYKGTLNLCNAIDQLETKPKAFIFISTVAVYGVEAGEMISETHPLNGSSPYSKSKILAEEFLLDWADRNKIVLSILRLPLIAGYNPPGNLGAMINGIKTGRYLSIGKANAKKSIVWVEDIAAIVPALVETGGIYNLTDGYHPSFNELETAISKALNKSLPKKIPLIVAKIIGKAGDWLGGLIPVNSNKLEKIISTLTFDDSKARSRLHWTSKKVLDKIPEII